MEVGDKKKSKIWIYILVIVVLIVVVFFLASGFLGSGFGEGISGGEVGEIQEWMEYELTDVRTGEIFMISDFAGKPIFLESFAVWCPTCTAQQGQIKALHEEPGFSEDELISISLDTDPGEDEARVLEHVESNGFDWYYAVSPIDLTETLIEQFGNSFVAAPTAPMVLICEDLTFRKLGGLGVRDVDKLKEEISAGCGEA